MRKKTGKRNLRRIDKNGGYNLMRETWRKILINLSLLISISVICLAIAEIVLRTIAPKYLDFQNAMDYSDLTVRALKPDIRNKLIHPANDEPVFHMTTNSLGLRADREISFQLPENTRRVLALGDSYTFGFGVEGDETYPAFLEKLLNTNPVGRYKFQVINAGFASGAATDSQYLYLREIGHKFSPEVVTLGFCLANDLIDIESNRWILDKNGDLNKIINPKDRFILAFFKKSALLAVLKHLSLHNKVERKNDEPLNLRTMEKVGFLLKKIKQLGKEQGFTFLLVIVPPPQFVLDENYKGQWNEIRKNLILFCKQNDISYVDPTSGLDKNSFFPGHVHFSKEGNQRVAEIIYNSLMRNGIH